MAHEERPVRSLSGFSDRRIGGRRAIDPCPIVSRYGVYSPEPDSFWQASGEPRDLRPKLDGVGRSTLIHDSSDQAPTFFFDRLTRSFDEKPVAHSRNAFRFRIVSRITASSSTDVSVSISTLSVFPSGPGVAIEPAYGAVGDRVALAGGHGLGPEVAGKFDRDPAGKILGRSPFDLELFHNTF